MISDRTLLRIAFSVCLGAVCTILPSRLSSAEKGQSDWTAPASAAAKKNPVAADEKSKTEGKQLYLRQCMECHGRLGKGDGAKAKKLSRPPGDLSSDKVARETDGELFWKITAGKDPMESYEKSLSEQQRWEMVNFIRTLASKSTTAQDTKTTAPK